MRPLSFDFQKNINDLDELLNVTENFDIIKRELEISSKKIVMYYVDGFVTAALMQKLMMHLLTVKDFGDGSHESVVEFSKKSVPSVEVDPEYDIDMICKAVLSGCTAFLAEGFGDGAIIIDTRSYPARVTAEPENDKVMRGSRDGFVETLIFNTAMIRRRIRDTSLTVRYLSVGTSSRTDISVVYIKGKADPEYVDDIINKISSIKTDSLVMGHQSLIECLIRKKWYNPFPKVRCTERPDAACASIMEGNIIILCDNSPEAIILPTCIFDFLQDTDDYYFPPFTGTYLRIVRQLVFWSAVILTPVWYLLVINAPNIPDRLMFLVPEDSANVPILVQLIMAELVIDGLKLASLNTPSVLSNSLSVVGALLLGDFAVQVGLLSVDVIFYMAFVAIANFTQSSYELGYAFKYIRMLLLLLTAIFGLWGFIAGIVIAATLVATNSTVNGKRNYLYPLIPFNGKAMARLLFRLKKR